CLISKQRDRISTQYCWGKIAKALCIFYLNVAQLTVQDCDRFEQAKPDFVPYRVLTRNFGICLDAERSRAVLQRKTQRRPRRRRRLLTDSNQLKKLLLVYIGYTIELVYVHFRDPGQELDESDSRIVDVVISPVRSINRY